jgi:hypothetical protein
MNRAVLLRILLGALLFAGFAVGGIVIGNLVAGDDAQGPQVDLSGGDPGIVEAADAETPGGANLPLAAPDGGGASTGGSSGGGRAGGSGTGGSGASDRGGTSGDSGGQGGAEDAGEAAPDGEPAEAEPAGGEPAADPAADPEAPAPDGGPPRLENEQLTQWLDACAEGGGAGCPQPGEGVTILGALGEEALPFAIDSAERTRCAGRVQGDDVVVRTTHPAAVVIRHAAGRPAAESSVAQVAAWEAAVADGQTALVETCVVLTDLPDGPGRYELDVLATSALDVSPRPEDRRTFSINLEPRDPRPETIVRLADQALDVSAAALSDGDRSVLPAGRTVQARDATCASSEGDGIPQAGSLDGVAFRHDRDLGLPDWNFYARARGGPHLAEGTDYWLCLWWVDDSGGVVDREQRLLALPDLHRYRLFVDRVAYNERASGLRFQIGAGPLGGTCTAGVIRVRAPGVASGQGASQSVDDGLLYEMSSTDPSGALEVCTQPTGTDAQGRSIDDARVDCECRARVVIDLPREQAVPATQGTARVPLKVRVDEGASGDDPGSPSLQNAGTVFLRWESFDEDATANGAAAFDASPAGDFSTPVLDTAASSVVLDAANPLHPAAVVTVVADRPVTGSVKMIGQLCGLPEQVALDPAATTHTIRFPNLCPGQVYDVLVALIGADGSTAYFSARPDSWPAVSGDDSQRHAWAGASLRTEPVQARIEATVEVTGGGGLEEAVAEITVGFGDTRERSETCLQIGEQTAAYGDVATVSDPVVITASVRLLQDPECGGGARSLLFGINGGFFQIPIDDLVTGRTNELGFGSQDGHELVLRIQSFQVVAG